MPTKYVAYTNLGEGQETGTFVDPKNYGGEDSDNFQYMLARRSVVPISDPDAAIAMGKAAEDGVPDEREEELAELRARVAELEAEKAAAAKDAADSADKSGDKSADKSGESAKTPSTPATPSKPAGA